MISITASDFIKLFNAQNINITARGYEISDIVKFDKTNFNCSGASFENCTFKEGLEFKDITVVSENGIKIEECKAKIILFKNVNITCPEGFYDEDDIFFDDARFKIRINNSQIESSIEIKSCKTEGRVDFNKLTVNGIIVDNSIVNI